MAIGGIADGPNRGKRGLRGLPGEDGADGSSGAARSSAVAAATVTEDATHRFATDAEKAAWNAKQDALGYTPYDAANPAGYTANSSDGALRTRSTHSGTQLAATISDFAAAVRATALTGLSLATSTAVAATDTILAAIGKLQAQVTLRALSATTITTTAPLAGGGSLAANRTLTIAAATTALPGSMSAADKLKLDGLGAVANPNLLTKTQAFDDAAWIKADVTVTANTIAAPDGTTTADTMTASTAGSFRFVRQAVTTSPGAARVHTLHVKRNNNDWIWFSPYNSGDCGWFNTATGAFGTVAATIKATVEVLPSGWYRIELALTTSTTTQATVGVSDSNAGFNAAAGAALYLWGAQLEKGVQPTPYQAVA